MSAERQIPGGAFLNETGTRQAQIPGSAFVNETVATTTNPALSLPTITNITDTTATPRVTITYP